MKKLVIKAANGSVEDFKMDAEASWTVKEVKSHIYRHYPTHPPLTCQKLIYGGKLLLDQATLSEVIPTSLEDSDDKSITIHLVAYERSKSMPSATSAASPAGVRRTPSVGGGSSQGETSENQGGVSRQPSVASVQEERRDERAEPPNPQQTRRVPLLVDPLLRHRAVGGGAMVPNPAPLDPQNLPIPAPGGGMAAAGGVAAVGGGGYPFLQGPQFYQSAYGAAYANQVQQWYYNYYQRGAPAFGAAGVGGEGMREEERNPLDLPANPMEANDLPEPEDQDEVPVNGPGGLGMMGGGAGGLRRRDLVDYLYMFSMIGFLVLMAFLTGSLGRLLIFAAGLTFMLLNQAGFFTLQRRRQAARAPMPPQGEGVQQQDREAGQQPPRGEQEEGVDGQQEVVAEPVPPPGAEGVEPPHPAPQAVPNPDPQRPGPLATIFVFVTSFFTSLVPQQRPDLQVN